MAVTFDAAKVYSRIIPRVVAAVNATAEAAAAAAKDKAPVRKIFQGGRGGTRLQSIEEAASEAATRARIGLAPGRVQTQTSPASRVHAFGPRRFLAERQPAFDVKAGRFRGTSGRFISAQQFKAAQPVHGTLRFDTPTTARGRYEIKTGRANIGIGSQTAVGGRLKNEISFTQAVESDRIITAYVVSPTPYAKYVEFGTRHARAQPFLRPGVTSQRALFRSRLERAVR